MTTPWGDFTGFDALGLSAPILTYAFLTAAYAREVTPFVLVFLIVLCVLQSIWSGYLSEDEGPRPQRATTRDVRQPWELRPRGFADANRR
jgi:hypothetical protein